MTAEAAQPPAPRPSARATVASARCDSYDPRAVRTAVAACVDALPDVQDAFRNARRVLLKPNLLTSRQPIDAHVNTHPAVVQALGEILRGEYGCELAIGDSCGSLTPAATAQAIRNSQMDRVARGLGADLYNVDAQPRHVVAFPQGRICTEITLPGNLDQFDLIVSVAKLKTHGLTYTTGAVKNIFGLVPGTAKKQVHAMAPHTADFVQALCDLYALVRPGVAFMDGVIGMEGRGPAHGRLRRADLIAASGDPVALDSFCAQVMGFRPLRIPLLKQCTLRGLGTAAPEAIDVRGEPAAAFVTRRFARPPAAAGALLLRLLPRRLLQTVVHLVTDRRAVIDHRTCIRCGECERNCPSRAIAFDPVAKRYLVDARRCIACYCCTEVCPNDAIDVRRTWPAF
ncbi:MAG: DUF362 domain-containing protein [Candidatus Brocadiaceae bacterium]|nr:DUF362 domain-containing protein [Candidatus Brocadiaceae bacterium]